MHRTRKTLGKSGARAVGILSLACKIPRICLAPWIAQARHAWRHNDGTFMSYDAEEQIRLEQGEEMARGGRARARAAKRAADGTFLAANATKS